MWLKFASGRFRSHLILPVALSNAIKRESAGLVPSARHEHGVVGEDRAGADRYVPCEGRDLFAPEQPSVEIERGQFGRAEQNVHALAVGARSRSGVSAAQVLEQPRPRRDLDVPEQFAVGRRVTGNVVLGKLRCCDALGPIRRDDEDAIYSGPRKLDHRLSYYWWARKGERWQASGSTTRRRSRPRSPWPPSRATGPSTSWPASSASTRP